MYIEKYGLIPDDTCMRIAIEYNYRNIGDLMNILIAHKYKPNYDILKCFIDHDKITIRFKNLLEIYNLELTRKYNNLEEKYNDLHDKYKKVCKENDEYKDSKISREIKEEDYK